MSRRRTDEAQVSLFPFLAVLLCTMGTLVVVFVLVAQKTSNEAATPETPEAVASGEPEAENASPLDDEYAAALVRTNAATIDEIRSETETLDWFDSELDGVQTRSRETLETQRERLANAEKAVAKILEDSTVLRRKLESLQAESVAAPGEDALSLQEKIDETEREIERLRAEIERLRAENANPKRSFAIVPYQGKKGTFRRPIYIECNERGVFLQPEGVPFAPTDFLLAAYPGNPFDAGVRAAARRLTETSGERTASGDALEPYPLLIIRPGGAEYYYPAVAALASWGGVYGYEFVDDDKEIEYPEPDPTLAAAVREQSEIARVRLAAALAEATSVRAAAAGSPYGASASGASFFGSGGPFADAANGGGALQSRLGGRARFGSSGAKLSESLPAGNGIGGANGTEIASGAFSPSGSGTGNAPDSSGIGAVGDSTPLPQYVGAFSQFVVGGPNGGGSATANVAQNPGKETAESVAVAQNSENETAESVAFVPNAAASQAVVDGSPAAPSSESTPFLAQFQAPPPSAPSTSPQTPKVDPRQTLGNSTFAAGATGSSDSGTLAGNGATTARIEPIERAKTESEPSERKAIRLSEELRRPATAGIERGVLVRVSAERLVFPKQPGLRRATEVVANADAPLSSKESELLDALVFCVKSWGVAGRNMYWAPFLKIEVAPDGEERFRELSEFCRTQGLPFVRVDADGSTD